MTYILEALYFLIPLWTLNIILNLCPWFFTMFKIKDYPFDCYGKIKNHRILGDSTTWAGLGLALFFGLVLGYMAYGNIIFGLGCGLITFFGHALGSFIKRRFNRKNMIILDQLNYFILGLIFFVMWRQLDVYLLLTASLLHIIVHPTLAWLGIQLGLRRLEN